MQDTCFSYDCMTAVSFVSDTSLLSTSETEIKYLAEKIHFILEKKSSGTLKRHLCKDNIAQEVHVSGLV